jgi:hypothetical protein
MFEQLRLFGKGIYINKFWRPQIMANIIFQKLGTDGNAKYR